MLHTLHKYNMPRIAFIAQIFTTLPLIGLIWFVQLVAYPLFAMVDPSSFPAYHEQHARSISWLVMPLMLIELIASAMSVWHQQPLMRGGTAILGLALTLSIWLTTFFLSVPQHSVLAGGFDLRAHRVLVQSNWLRTAAWSARGVLLLWCMTRKETP
jgi:hypothetical protein